MLIHVDYLFTSVLFLQQELGTRHLTADVEVADEQLKYGLESQSL